MAKKWISWLLLTAIIPVTGCRHDSIPVDIPDPINVKIDAFIKQTHLCSDASIREFLFQNAKVYGFSGGTCTSEPSSGIYDTTGNLICTLGGLIGATTCNGEPFSKATLLRTIWENK